MLRVQNFLGLFMSTGFFIAVIFSILNFNNPLKMIIVTMMVTFVFYILMVFSASLFLRTYSHKQRHFQKEMYEDASKEVARLLIEKEYKIEKVLQEVSKINQNLEK